MANYSKQPSRQPINCQRPNQTKLNQTNRLVRFVGEYTSGTTSRQQNQAALAFGPMATVQSVWELQGVDVLCSKSFSIPSSNWRGCQWGAEALGVGHTMWSHNAVGRNYIETHTGWKEWKWWVQENTKPKLRSWRERTSDTERRKRKTYGDLRGKEKEREGKKNRERERGSATSPKMTRKRKTRVREWERRIIGNIE